LRPSTISPLLPYTTLFRSQPPQSRETDEGSAAHIFQLSIVALFPTLIAFVVTADWKKPLRTIRPLIFSAATLIAAFAALFYLEQDRKSTRLNSSHLVISYA